MANVIALNTTQHPGLVQVLVMTPTGLFDFQAQKAGASVTLTAAPADQIKKAAIKELKHPVNGNPYLVET